MALVCRGYNSIGFQILHFLWERKEKVTIMNLQVGFKTTKIASKYGS
jgi:hypothetical protein